MIGNFVYYAERFNDGGLIEVFFANENEIKNPTINGVNLFSDDEIKDFLISYRKTGFICCSSNVELISECKRLAKKFNLSSQFPV